jgi:tricorn protease
MKKILGALSCLLAAAGVCRGDGETPLLLQQPAISRTQVAFVYAGDLWTVPREGGEARRLTNGTGLEVDPVFSPDGSQLAFTGEYEGNLDVYVIAATGGVPRRLTYHPGVDRAVGWSPDGKQVLFRSDRASYSRFNRLFTVPAAGGPATELPLPMGEQAAFSPDGQSLAYVPFWNRRATPNGYISWKHYRGGKAPAVWIAALADSHIDKVPRQDSNDFNPMWVGQKVYFLSDRNGPTTLFAYDPQTKEVTQALPDDGGDVLSASATADAIVYERLGELGVLDLATGNTRRLNVRLGADLADVRPHFEKIAKRVHVGRISPTGARAVFEALGEVVTVPAEKGDSRNLTQTPGTAERDPAWSPDGKSIAYFSDESGEYQLYVRDQRGRSEPRKLRLDDAPTFYYDPVWSPDSKRIAFTDAQLHVGIADVESGKVTRVDTDTYDSPRHGLDPSWSPDGKWLSYTKQLRNHLRAVFLYAVETGKAHQVTDGLSDAGHAVWDRNGKYLYFTASTNAGTSAGWLDMSSFDRPVTRSVYLVVLAKDQPSPLAPESDEEDAAAGPLPGAGPAEREKDRPAAAAKNKGDKDGEKGEKKKEPVAVRVDLPDLDQRILPLPMPARDYVALRAGKSGVLFLVEQPERQGGGRFGPPGLTLHKFDLDKRKAEKVLDGIRDLDVSFNGEKLLVRHGDKWTITSAASPKTTDALKLDEVEVRVEPRAAWRQMYHEVWRIERDFLYDPHHHGIDLQTAEKKYRRYLDGIGSRADLNYLFSEMLGDLTIGHLYIGGGDSPEIKRVPGGLLGADYRVENGRYRFARVYRGGAWNPNLRAPLTQPGVNVAAGDYLLAVDGRNVTADDDVHRFFEGTAGRAIVLKVGPTPDGKGAREVTVVPVESEQGLRNMAWIDDNRRKVDELSKGRLAYVYVPDTSVPGYTSFNRYYFAQTDKEGAVIDERFNGGGTAADYMIDAMRRPLLSYWTTRAGEDFTTPVGSIFGPKAMLINEFAGSGGDALPWYFRRTKIGPLVGKRTWGGLVGIYDYPQLIDGGQVTAPRLAFWSPDGKWDVENHGVAPDVEVDLDPQAVRQGHDPQLEKAVQVVLAELEKHPPAKPKHPAYPDYSRAGVPNGSAGPRRMP